MRRVMSLLLVLGLLVMPVEKCSANGFGKLRAEIEALEQ
jgi:hypothetical protein